MRLPKIFSDTNTPYDSFYVLSFDRKIFSTAKNNTATIYSTKLFSLFKISLYLQENVIVNKAIKHEFWRKLMQLGVVISTPSFCTLSRSFKEGCVIGSHDEIQLQYEGMQIGNIHALYFLLQHCGIDITTIRNRKNGTFTGQQANSNTCYVWNSTQFATYTIGTIVDKHSLAWIASTLTQAKECLEEFYNNNSNLTIALVEDGDEQWVKVSYTDEDYWVYKLGRGNYRIDSVDDIHQAVEDTVSNFLYRMPSKYSTVNSVPN